MIGHYTEDQPEFQILLDAFMANKPVQLPGPWSNTPLYIETITHEWPYNSKQSIKVEFIQPYLNRWKLPF